VRRIICLLLLAAILLAAPGCSPIIDGEYYVVTDHKDENGLGSADSDVIEVKTYQGIKTAILTFIKEGREQGVIKVSGYDGDVSEAISKASLEIITGTAIGAYAVEYITHSYSRIVSYYEANVFINYRRPQEQVKNVMYLNYVSAVQGALGTALNTHRDYLVISISSELVTPEYIKNYILEYYRENPQSVIAPPEAEITVYEGEQLPKILEIELSYPYTAEQSAEMRKALGLRAQKLLEGAQAPSDEYTALNICSALISAVEYSPEGGQRVRNDNGGRRQQRGLRDGLQAALLDARRKVHGRRGRAERGEALLEHNRSRRLLLPRRPLRVQAERHRERVFEVRLLHGAQLYLGCLRLQGLRWPANLRQARFREPALNKFDN